jgi:ATP-dependent DNA helicase DinG
MSSSRKLDWKRHFPYEGARDIQAEALQLLQDNWDKYDVFVVQAPTAFGKTAVARTLMNSLHSVSCITPNNMLVNQFTEEFPDTPTLHRLDSYYCDEWKRPCPTTRAKLMKFCKGCTCSAALVDAKFRKGPGIYNYHTYLAHKLYRDVLVVDEAHNLIRTIQDRQSIKLWKHDLKYPSNMWTPEQITKWISGLPPKKQQNKKIRALRESAQYSTPEYVYQHTKDWFNGKGTVRGDPEERDLIRLIPVDVSSAPPMFWPAEVRKIVLLSATIGPKDIEALGLDKRRVCYLACASPIPAENRPIVLHNSMPVTRDTIQNRIGDIAARIEEIGDRHNGEKGVVHVTYQLAQLLQGRLPARYRFHDKYNKADVYKKFRESGKDVVLVACGMYEGIDLPEDLGRWQVVAKVPWPSLASPAIKHLAELDPDWYIWEAMKVMVQACGRICRTPTDFGVTYVLDSTFTRLMREGDHMVPQWFRDALQ